MSELPSRVNLNFPPHECGLYLEHNPNRDYYQTVAEWLSEELNHQYDWRDDESRQLAIDTNELWTLQWYPRTPIGCYMIAAPTLEQLLKLAAERAENGI